MLTVDIDVGGTLTDGLFSDGEKVACVKVDTTPHDLTVCLLDCLTQCAGQFGFADLAGFLEKVELIRWSTTITSNVLAELRGPRIGLLVSRGHEKDLYGEESQSSVLGRLRSEKDVRGLSESAPPERCGRMTLGGGCGDHASYAHVEALPLFKSAPRRALGAVGAGDDKYDVCRYPSV